MRKVVALLNDCRSWWADCCQLSLKRKFGMEGKLKVVGSHATWRNCMRDVHEKGWQEEVAEKSSHNWYRSSHNWYRLAKEDFGQERYVKEFGDN